jgi:hypothetical protein
MSTAYPIRRTIRQRLPSMNITNEFRCGVAYGSARIALALYAEPRTFPTSWRFQWHGTQTTEPYGVAALYSMAGTPTSKVFAQTLIGVSCWVWLFRETFRALGRNRFAKVVVSFFVCVSLSAPIAVWDRCLLPESLKFSLFAAIAASWMMVQRRRGHAVSWRVGAAVLAASALVSSVVFLFVAVPVALGTTFRVKRRYGLAVLAAISGILSIVAIRPSTITSGPVSSSLIAERSMNIVGERILPDPFFRRRLQESGLPRNADPSLFRRRKGSDDNYLLFRNEPLRKFAQSFPVWSYVQAVFARPGELLRVSMTALNGRDSAQLAGAGGDEIIPLSVSNIVWGWSAPFHLAVLLGTIAATVSLRNSTRKGSKRFLTGTTIMATLTTIGAGTLVWTNGSDAQRELLVFDTASRLSLITSMMTVAVLWARTTLEVDEQGVKFKQLITSPEQRQRIASFGRIASFAMLSAVIGVALVSSVLASNNGPTVRAPTAKASLIRSVESQLRGRNIVVSKRVHEMLRHVLVPWQNRDDLQAAMSNEDGLPNIEALTLWARGFPDSSTESFAEHLGAIDELRSRLGLISADTGIVPVLYWTLKNEPKLERDFTNVIGHLADYWNGRPEVRSRFTVNGRVDVIGFLKDANAIQQTDPLSANVPFDFFVVRQAIHELERNQ